MSTLVFLTNPSLQERLSDLAKKHDFDVCFTFSKDDLDDAVGDILISFATGVIVPRTILNRFRPNAYNIHPASPDFPGRDPHHFAHYNGARHYGATAHMMTPKVDDGPILFYQSEDVVTDATPSDLLDQAERLGLDAMDRLLRLIAKGDLKPDPNLSWASRKSTRQKFQSLCRLGLFDQPEETRRRVSAVAVPGRNNAKLFVDDTIFVLDENQQYDVLARQQAKYSGWTLDGYRDLVRQAKARFAFATYDERPDVPHVLWRHDIDYSIHRALKLAEIEAEEGVRTTHMFMLNIPFYNLLDYDLQVVAREIIALGHKAGLHFYVDTRRIESWSETELALRMQDDRDRLSDYLQAPVEVVSYHDPTAGGLIDFDADVMAGMVNCYSERLKRDYEYCSDSNGHWRHRPIPEVLSDTSHDRLHVLTHPAWWADRPLPPRARIEAAMLEHNRWIMAEYDDHLARSGRENITD